MQRRKKRPRSLDIRAKAIIIIVVIAAALVTVVARCGSYSRQNREQNYRDGYVGTECLMQVTIPDDVPEIKLSYTGFDVSFNPSMHQPNYAVWELTGDETRGEEPRASKFKPDPDVLGCATLDDYRNSGYDRGHMAPAGDMKWDSQAMLDSHYLTNICPQSHTLNGGRWASLENKCREWAVRDSAIIIICGPILTDRMPLTIGAQAIPVPERFFKIVMAPYAMPPRAIGFIMPNLMPQEGLEALAVSVDQIEEITGFDFFSCLPDDIEAEIESQANFRQWNKRKL